MFPKFLLCFYIILLCLLESFFGADALTMAAAKSHTCVIGAGYSGLAAARYLKEYGVNFTVYEAAKDIGGTWRFDPLVGTDEYGVPIFTSQYKYLRTNTARQTMEFNGFPFPEDTPSYPSGTCFFKYIKNFAAKFGLMKYIKLHSFVTSMKLDDDHWDVTYIHSKSKTNHTVYCDNVVIASGQYVKPNVPSLNGQDNFKGKILHSHDYRDPDHYKGLDVLVVGAGPSGWDLSMQLVNVARKLVHSHRLAYKFPKKSEHYVKKPDIKTFKSNGVVFEDGSFEKIDVVILCTGYKFVQPYIHEDAQLWDKITSVLPLHRNIVNIRHPTMTFIGVVQRVLIRVLDAQAQYIASLIGSKFQLPPEDEMMKLFSTGILKTNLDKRTSDTIAVRIKDMYGYLAILTEEAGIDKVPPVIVKIQESNLAFLLEDNYRDYDYQVIDDYNFKRWYNPRNVTCHIDEEM